MRVVLFLLLASSCVRASESHPGDVLRECARVLKTEVFPAAVRTHADLALRNLAAALAILDRDATAPVSIPLRDAGLAEYLEKRAKELTAIPIRDKSTTAVTLLQQALAAERLLVARVPLSGRAGKHLGAAVVEYALSVLQGDYGPEEQQALIATVLRPEIGEHAWDSRTLVLPKETADQLRTSVLARFGEHQVAAFARGAIVYATERVAPTTPDAAE